MDFNDAVTLVLDHEGGLSNHPNDRGGLTKFGISKKAYPKLNIEDLTLEQAKNIYKIDYWDACSCEKLPQALRLMVFDCAVNQGVKTAIKILQEAVGVKQDGYLGPITFEAMKELENMQLIDRYAKIRLRRYTTDPTWQHFGRGWAKRLLDVSLICAFLSDVKIKSTLP